MKATSTNLSGKLIEMLPNTTAPLGVLCDLEGTAVSTYAYNRGPCEQTFVAFSNHVDKKHLSLTKLCSILQELTQYQASGIE